MNSILVFYSPVTDPATAQDPFSYYTAVFADSRTQIGWLRHVCRPESAEDAAALAPSLVLSGETLVGVSALA